MFKDVWVKFQIGTCWCIKCDVQSGMHSHNVGYLVDWFSSNPKEKDILVNWWCSCGNDSWSVRININLAIIL